MEILITNKQRLIKISYLRVERLLKKALNQLISDGLSLRTRRKNFFRLISRRKSAIEISVLFLNDKRMREMNLRFRGKDKATDVLSFPQFGTDSKDILQYENQIMPLFLGDIVINLHQAKRQALENKTTLINEVKKLLIHGLLHLLGFDHEKGSYQARIMASAEAKLLKTLIRN